MFVSEASAAVHDQSGLLEPSPGNEKKLKLKMQGLKHGGKKEGDQDV